jgi:DNA-binding NtrC family response regulator
VAEILLLEDDLGLQFTFRAALEEQGHDVITASNCAEAIKALQVHKPDVLILDLMVGSEISINVASFAAYKLPDTEVVYVTGSSLFSQGELFELSRNIRWVLRKPVPLRELTSMVQHALLTKPDTKLRTYDTVMKEIEKEISPPQKPDQKPEFLS